MWHTFRGSKICDSLWQGGVKNHLKSVTYFMDDPWVEHAYTEIWSCLLIYNARYSTCQSLDIPESKTVTVWWGGVGYSHLVNSYTHLSPLFAKYMNHLVSWTTLITNTALDLTQRLEVTDREMQAIEFLEFSQLQYNLFNIYFLQKCSITSQKYNPTTIFKWMTNLMFP